MTRFSFIKNIGKGVGRVFKKGGKGAAKAAEAAKGAKKGWKGLGKAALGGGLAGVGSLAGGLVSGLGSALGKLANNKIDSQPNNVQDTDYVEIPQNPNVPSESQALSDSIGAKLDTVTQSQVDADIRKAKADEEGAKIQKNLMDQILAASEALNDRTHNLVNEHGLGSINKTDVEAGKFYDGTTVPGALMTRGQITRMYEKKNKDTRMSDILRLLAANNEILGNVDLHLGLLIRQGTVIPQANAASANILKRLSESDKKLATGLDAKAKKLNDEFRDAKRAQEMKEEVIANAGTSGAKLSANQRAEKAMGLLAALGVGLPAVAALVDGMIYQVQKALGIDELFDPNGNTSTSYEEIENFQNLSKEDQAAAIKKGAIDNMKFVGGMAAAEATVLGGKKLIQKAGQIAAKKSATTAAKKTLLSRLTPAAMKVVGKRLLAKIGARTVSKTASKKIPILGAAFGIWNGIKRASRGDWAGAGLEIVSGLMGGSGAGILGSVAIDTGLVYRDYRKAMKALEEGDMQTLNDLGITNEDIQDITAQVTAGELKRDDGKTPEQAIGIKDPKAKAIENQVANELGNSTSPVTQQPTSRQGTSGLKPSGRYSDGQKHAKGGWIFGPSHAQGGVTTELEGGEFVINKEAAIENKDILEAINDSKKQLSDIVARQLGMQQQAVQPQVIQVNNVETTDALKESIDANSTTSKLNDNLGLLTSTLQGIKYEMAEQRRQETYRRLAGAEGVGNRGGNVSYSQYNVNTNQGDNSSEDSEHTDYGGEDLSNIDWSKVNAAAPEQVYQRADYVAKYLMGKGFTPEQASGMAGVLMAESNVDPTAVNKVEVRRFGWHVAGKGICQWSNSRNQDFIDWYREKTGVDNVYPNQASLKDQLEFMLFEMRKRPAFMKAIRASSTPVEAADAMFRGFENGGRNSLASISQINRTYGANNYVSQIRKRGGYARNVFVNLQAKKFHATSDSDLGLPSFDERGRGTNVTRTQVYADFLTPKIDYGKITPSTPWLAEAGRTGIEEVGDVKQTSEPLAVVGGGGNVNYAPNVTNNGGSTYNDNRHITYNTTQQVVNDEAKAAEV